MNELLTVNDVARICQIHEVTVRRHIASGQLRVTRVGKGVRVRKEDLDSYLAPPSAPQDRPRTRVARRLQGKPFTRDDTFWSVVGSVTEPVDSWVSGDKHRALAEAYQPKA